MALEAVMAYLFAQGDGASQAAMRTHAAAVDVWQRGRGAGLSKRLDAVLDRTVTDAQIAERALNYVISGNHVAAIAWLDDPARPLDAADAERRVAALPGVRDSLLVPRDERTLYVWLHVVGGDRTAEWMGMLADLGDARVAFGELAAGIEGFRLSHMQAQSAGAVIAASRVREKTMIVRYRDVAALSFLVDRPAESREWARAVLGDLAGQGDERERLRETLRVFLEEGENAQSAASKLFVHRNTVKYRIDRAIALLPEPLGARRLEVGLALRYCDWVGCEAGPN
jgi:DNA-binding PucR family transcriptional regulator